MKKLTYVIVILFAVILAMGCTNLFNPDDGTGEPDTAVYTAGYYEDPDTGNDVACYWIDTNADGTDVQLVSLSDPSNNARANKIFVYGESVYVAGFEGVPGNENAVLWKDGEKHQEFTIGTETRGEAKSVWVDSSGTYVIGYYRTGTEETLWYWDGTQESVFLESNSSADATAIAVFDGVSYISGYYESDTLPFVATYWADGVEVPSGGLYSESSRALDLDINEAGEIYLSGFYDDGTTYSPGYWVGEGDVVTLESDQISFSFGIEESNGSVYTAGFHGSGIGTACYWNGTERTDLAPGRAFDVVERNGELYISGYHYDGEKRVACYWKNGNLTTLYDSGLSGVNAEANSIFYK